MLFVALAAFSCGDDYDDTALKKDVDDLKSRVEKLEAWCATANSQLNALQEIITNLESKDYVTGISPIMDGTDVVGYTINFTKSDPITIKNGVDGKNGITPVIGVKQDTDGNYYWTVKTGDSAAIWLKDADGKQIRTTGDTGKTPQISVTTDTDGKLYWKVDNEWLKDASGNKIPATGDQGATGEQGDAIFAKDGITVNEDNVVFTLKDQSTITLPLLKNAIRFESYDTFQMNSFDATDIALKFPVNMKKSEYAALKAEITSVGGTSTDIVTRAASVTPWAVKLSEPAFDKTTSIISTQPKVSVTVPIDVQLGDKALLKVTFVDTDGNESSSTRVLVYDTRIAVTGIKFTKEAVELKVGKDEMLVVAFEPADATNQNLTWSSADKAVATVDNVGKVTGVKAGTTTITATTEDGGFEASCPITVSNIPVEGVSLSMTSSEVSIDGTTAITVTFTPADATNKKVSWKSGQTNIATVSDAGVVTGIAVGTAVITATTEDGNKTATYTVTVVDRPAFVFYGEKNRKMVYYDGKELKYVEGAVSSYVSAAMMVGKDFYGANSEHIYKNGVIFKDMPSDYKYFGDFCIEGTSIYTVGTDKSFDNAYWKDGQKLLTAEKNVSFSSIRVLGGDVFIATRNTDEITVLKNGTKIWESKSVSFIRGLEVHNGKLYLAGTDFKKCYLFSYNGTTMVEEATIDGSSIGLFKVGGNSLFTTLRSNDQMDLYKNVDWSQALPALAKPAGFTEEPHVISAIDEGADTYVYGELTVRNPYKTTAYCWKNSADPMRMPADSLTFVAHIPK